MDILYRLKMELMGLFGKGKDKEKCKRRSKRELLSLDIKYVVGQDATCSDKGRVININRGGLCFETLRYLKPYDTIFIALNPHTISKYVNVSRIRTDDAGRYAFRVLWVKKQDMGCSVGGQFLATAYSRL